MVKCFYLLLLLLSGYLNTLTAAQIEQKTVQFTVASCNVLAQMFYDRNRDTNDTSLPVYSLGDRREFFRQAFTMPDAFKDTDVICLQEWNPADFAQQVPAGYKILEGDNKNPSVALLINEQRCELLYKETPYAKQALCAVIRLKNTPTIPITVVSCHIPRPLINKNDINTQLLSLRKILPQATTTITPERSWLSWIFGYKATAQPINRKELPLIIAGDFNVHSPLKINEIGTSPFYTKLLAYFPQPHWADAALELNKASTPTVYASQGDSRLDYMFYTKQSLANTTQWDLVAKTHTVYPQEKNKLIKHTIAASDKDKNKYTKSDYFSDHAIIKTTFELAFKPIAAPSQTPKLSWYQWLRSYLPKWHVRERMKKAAFAVWYKKQQDSSLKK